MPPKAAARPVQPIYIPALPSGHFASLSETAQRDYVQTVRAAERGLVSGRKVQTGPQFMTPLHPDDPRVQESGGQQQVALVHCRNTVPYLGIAV